MWKLFPLLFAGCFKQIFFEPLSYCSSLYNINIWKELPSRVHDITDSMQSERVHILLTCASRLILFLFLNILTALWYIWYLQNWYTLVNTCLNRLVIVAWSVDNSWFVKFLTECVWSSGQLLMNFTKIRTIWFLALYGQNKAILKYGVSTKRMETNVYCWIIKLSCINR